MSGDDTDRTACLYVVATPIGHLADITHRAIETLHAVDLIVCEDTRRTRTLLAHYAINAKLLSLHQHNERARAETVIARLQAGEKVAYVTDAGTPSISDPGYRLVDSVTAAGLEVVPIPGPSSVTALLSVAGMPADRFIFEGFLPTKKGQRERRLAELSTETRTMVFFESPFRIARTLEEMSVAWGARSGCVGRELTKKFEEIRRGPLPELASWAKSKTARGEFVLAIAGASARPAKE